jgi:putative FmdB family regulatory protein
MPIYEFACPKCRKIYSFLSKKVNPGHMPKCPKCGSEKLQKQMSRFAMVKGMKEPGPSPTEGGEEEMPGFDESRMEKVMSELERDMGHMDENNPRHLAHMMKKMKEAMPPGSIPKEMDEAIKRLEKGEDPEKIEADMGDIFGEMMPADGGEGGYGGGYSKDPGLYDY